MGKKHNSKFPAVSDILAQAKIKKIIQYNQDIGKLCNTIPPIIEKSLEIFLDDIVERLNQIVSDYELSKITLSALKKSLEDSQYEFMKDALKDITDLEKGNKTKRPRKKYATNECRAADDYEDSDYGNKPTGATPAQSSADKKSMKMAKNSEPVTK